MLANPPGPVMVWCGTSSLITAVNARLTTIIATGQQPNGEPIDSTDEQAIRAFATGLQARLVAECQPIGGHSV